MPHDLICQHRALTGPLRSWKKHLQHSCHKNAKKTASQQQRLLVARFFFLACSSRTEYVTTVTRHSNKLKMSEADPQCSAGAPPAFFSFLTLQDFFFVQFHAMLTFRSIWSPYVKFKQRFCERCRVSETIKGPS